MFVPSSMVVISSTCSQKDEHGWETERQNGVPQNSQNRMVQFKTEPKRPMNVHIHHFLVH